MAEQQQRDSLKEIEGLTDLPEPIDVDLGDKNKDERESEKKVGSDAKTKGEQEKPQEDENVVALRRQLAAEKRRAEAAEARNRDIEERRRQAEEQTAEGQLRLISNSIDAETRNKDRAKADLAHAYKSGEWDRVADLQVVLNEAQIKLDSLGRGKAELERAAEREQKERERAGQQQRRSFHDDPVEEMIATTGVSSKSAAWLRRNPDCVTDRHKNKTMLRAHEDAVDDGLDVDSLEYFAFIEKRLGIGHDDDAEHQPAQRQVTQRKDEGRSTAAPVSRSSNGDGRGSRERTVTLSPAERQFCDESKIKYEDYARNKVALKKEGRLQ